MNLVKVFNKIVLMEEMSFLQVTASGQMLVTPLTHPIL